MKQTAILGLCSAFFSLGAMIIGHLGAYDLNWMVNQISTFAAQGPYDDWITASMLLSILSMCCLSILISRYKLLGTHYTVHILPLIIGAAASGLLLVASFEEVVLSRTNRSVVGIMQQSYHNAGEMVLSNGLFLLCVVAGCECVIFQKGRLKIITGILVAGLGFASYALRLIPWPRWFGIVEKVAGLQQKASFFSIWLAIVLLLLLAFNKKSSCDAPPLVQKA